MTTRYPSRQEVAEHQRAELERLHAEKACPEYEAPTLPPIYYRTVVREKGYAAKTTDARPESPFLEEQARFLRQIRDHPENGGLATLYRALGIGVGTGNAVLRDLKVAGYLFVREQKTTSRVGGRSRKIAVLTRQGMEMLEAYEKKTKAS